MRNQDVVPHLENGYRLPTWVGVGGSPQSVVRAARLGFSLMLAIIGGRPARFAPFADLFQRALAKLWPVAASCRRARTRSRRADRRTGT